jgi:GT2 family glycosyltransferase
MITFAIPYYQNLAFLERAIESVFAQTVSHWKLIVCDDSTDGNAANLVESYRDPRVRYVRNVENIGMVGNWNQCLDLVDTAAVTILHADDELLPTYAETVSEALEDHPEAVFVFCQAHVIGTDSKPAFSFPDTIKHWLVPSYDSAFTLEGEAGARALLRGCFIFCPSVCFRKAVVGSRRFSSDWKMVQDLEFWLRLLLEGKSFVGIPHLGYAYRRHPSNSTSLFTQNALRFEEELRLYHRSASKFLAAGWKKAARTASRAGVVKLNLIYCLAMDLLTLRWKGALTKATLLFQAFFWKSDR